MKPCSELLFLKSDSVFLVPALHEMEHGCVPVCLREALIYLFFVSNRLCEDFSVVAEQCQKHGGG